MCLCALVMHFYENALMLYNIFVQINRGRAFLYFKTLTYAFFLLDTCLSSLWYEVWVMFHLVAIIICNKNVNVSLFFFVRKSHESKNVYPPHHFYKEYHENKMIKYMLHLISKFKILETIWILLTQKNPKRIGHKRSKSHVVMQNRCDSPK